MEPIPWPASRCAGCGDIRVPALVRCPACGGSDIAPAELSGRGTIVATTVVHAGSHRPVPWTGVLVDVEEGLRLVGIADGRVAVGDTVGITADDGGVPVFSGMGR